MPPTCEMVMPPPDQGRVTRLRFTLFDFADGERLHVSLGGVDYFYSVESFAGLDSAGPSFEPPHSRCAQFFCAVSRLHFSLCLFLLIACDRVLIYDPAHADLYLCDDGQAEPDPTLDVWVSLVSALNHPLSSSRSLLVLEVRPPRTARVATVAASPSARF